MAAVTLPSPTDLRTHSRSHPPSSVCLWSVNKKKPLTTVKQAHGCHGDGGLEQPHWVASVAALQNSDTVASGACGCERRPPSLSLDRGGVEVRLVRPALDKAPLVFVASCRFTQLAGAAVEV